MERTATVDRMSDQMPDPQSRTGCPRVRIRSLLSDGGFKSVPFLVVLMFPVARAIKRGNKSHREDDIVDTLVAGLIPDPLLTRHLSSDILWQLLTLELRSLTDGQPVIGT